MNRPLFIAAFVLIVASLSLSAQRGGGGHAGGGGGGHAGFGGGHSGFSGGGHAFSAPRSSGFSGRSFNRGSAFNHGGFNRGAFNRGSVGRFGRSRSGVGVRIRSYPFYGRNCWGCWGSGWGYPYLGGIDPYWWWGSDNDSDPDAGQPYAYGYDNGLANQMNQQGIPMRPAPDTEEQNYNSRSAAPQHHRQEPAETVQATVLVFRDQHQEEVQNYAIVGQTLWNFAPQRTQKIPLSDLDIDATQKANDERGISFRLPAAHEGQ